MKAGSLVPKCRYWDLPKKVLIQECKRAENGSSYRSVNELKRELVQECKRAENGSSYRRVNELKTAAHTGV